MTKKEEIKAGVKAAFPVVMGYLPIGIAYGILAIQAGLSGPTTLLMSGIVFAGSSQLIAVNMVAGGTPVLAIVIMTFLVNLRHILMSAALSLPLKNEKRELLPVLSFFITDESFAVGNTSIKNYQHKGLYFLGLGLTGYLGWFVSSVLGVILGSVINIFESQALNFVLPAMFIALMVMQIERKKEIIVGILAAVFSIVLVYLLPANWNIILATIMAATLGVIIEKWR